MLYGYVLNVVAGSIPSSFCNNSGISIDVDGSGIGCYSGCLTSAHVLITGASSDCHNNSQLRLFIVCISIGLGIVAMFNFGYYRRVDVASTGMMSLPSWCACLMSDPTTSPT